MRKELLLSLIFFCTTLVSYAQNATVKGKISDEDSKPVAGATVYAEGTGVGTITSQTGEYILSLPAGSYTIKVSYIGYTEASQLVTLTAGQQFNYSPTLLEDNEFLKEAVVVGYGTKFKKDVTGNIVSVPNLIEIQSNSVFNRISS